jgi:hypothetical protein
MKTIIIAAALVFAQPALAQTPQKQRISYRAPASTTQYTQQHVIEAGDVPGHQIRVFEIHRTFGSTAVGVATSASDKQAKAASDAPVFNGIEAKEIWTRGFSDYTDGSGRVHGYSVYNLESGDKIFSSYEGLALTPAGGKTNATYVITFTGGTGQFKNIRGMMRGTGIFTFSGGKVGSIDTQYEGEYWIER